MVQKAWKQFIYVILGFLKWSKWSKVIEMGQKRSKVVQLVQNRQFRAFGAKVIKSGPIGPKLSKKLYYRSTVCWQGILAIVAKVQFDIAKSNFYILGTKSAKKFWKKYIRKKKLLMVE